MKYGLPDEIYNKIKNVINNFPQYKFKIYGSRARGVYKENSDIDISVFENTLEIDKFNILNEMDLIDMPYMIDIIFIDNNTKKELLNSILKEGVDF